MYVCVCSNMVAQCCPVENVSLRFWASWVRGTENSNFNNICLKFSIPETLKHYNSPERRPAHIFCDVIFPAKASRKVAVLREGCSKAKLRADVSSYLALVQSHLPYQNISDLLFLVLLKVQFLQHLAIKSIMHRVFLREATRPQVGIALLRPVATCPLCLCRRRLASCLNRKLLLVASSY